MHLETMGETVHPLTQLAQYLRWVYPAMIFIVVQPMALILVWWITMTVCKKQHARWTVEHGPAELRRINRDLQNVKAERGREIVRLRALLGEKTAAIRATTIAQGHAIQALGGVQEET